MAEKKASMILSMVIFGSIGVFVRLIPMSSAAVACFRGICGALFILVYMKIKGSGLRSAPLAGNMKLLVISGAAIGFNWILLFEAYRYTSVAVATLCYYMQPVFVILLSPLVTGERLTVPRMVCVACSLAGMALITGIGPGSLPGAGETRGIVFGLMAAMLYASVIFLNKFLRDISELQMTFFQLLYAGLAVMPYALLRGSVFTSEMSAVSWTMLAALGIIHTGIAYTLYFGSMKTLDAQTTALFSYIDPVCAIFFSYFLLGEPIGGRSLIGAVLILFPTMIAEIAASKKGGKAKEQI
ncbi:MAG: EamA family transporter [Eubacteriaceae bacterium]|nr:EamA family transporter [Eubacteriaceae bacterium]